MKTKKCPVLTTPGAALDIGGGTTVQCHYSQFAPTCQAATLPALDQAAVYLTNAQALLDDPDPRALCWACHLLALAQAALALDLLEVTE